MTSLLWLALGLIFIFVELLIGDLSMLMLAGGALAAAGVSLLGTPLWADVTVFAIVSLALVLLVRPPLRRKLAAANQDGEIESHPAILAGKNAVVEEEVTRSTGLIKISGKLWSARSYVSGQAFQPGDSVVVVQIKGNTAFVERALE